MWDLINESLPELQKFLYYILQERSQLYGSLAHLMNITETEEFEVHLDTLKIIHDNYMIYATPSGDGESFKIELRERITKNE